MKKILLLVLLLGLIISAFIIFGGTHGGDIPTGARTAQEEPSVYIGVFESAASDNVSGSAQERLGISFALSQNDRITIDGTEYLVELKYVDSSVKDFNEENAAKALIESEKVSAILASDYDLSEQTAELFYQAGIPVIGAYSGRTAKAEGQRLFFGVCSDCDLQAGALASFAYNKGFTSAAVVTKVGDGYSKDLGQLFQKEFTRLGGEVTEYHYNSAQRNFEELAAKIKGDKLQMVYFPGSCDMASLFVSHAREKGLNVPIMGAGQWDSVSLLKLLGSEAGEIYFSTPFQQDSNDNKKFSDFVLQYREWIANDSERAEKNGSHSYVSAYPALGCDAFNFLIAAIKQADSTEPRLIAQALRTVEYDGIFGKLSFLPQEQAMKRTVYIKTINTRSGDFETVQQSSAAK